MNHRGLAMPHAYTEDQLVEQPAIGLFAELGRTTVSAHGQPRRLAHGGWGESSPNGFTL